MRHITTDKIHYFLFQEDALDTNSVYNDFGCLSDLCFTEEQTDGLINEIQTEMLADLQVHPVSEETATAGESEEDDNMTQEKETRDARPPPRRFKRKTRVFDDRYPFKKWNKTIPYIIDGSIGKTCMHIMKKRGVKQQSKLNRQIIVR